VTHLHIAAMPFPSVQGTQAAVKMMMDAEYASGLSPELLTYAHGGFEFSAPWPHHRVSDLVRDRSLRSGPSWRKVFQDAQLVLEARRQHRRLRPEAVVAHHVEATAAALAAGIDNVVFFAHTALGAELPTYVPKLASVFAGRAADALDVTLARRASRVVAVSPVLASRLSELSGREVRYVPIPWVIPDTIEAAEREKARARFSFGALDPVVLYAGNLDAYQGIEVMVEAFVHMLDRRPDAWLLLATESDRDPVERLLWAGGAAGRVRYASLADEPDRRAAHAAADVALVPRGAVGGLPMKLLDALSRGVPTVATRRACAGLELGGAATVVGDDDPQAIAAGALLSIEGRSRAREIGARGRTFVESQHSRSTYLRGLGWKAVGGG